MAGEGSEFVMGHGAGGLGFRGIGSVAVAKVVLGVFTAGKIDTGGGKAHGGLGKSVKGAGRS